MSAPSRGERHRAPCRGPVWISCFGEVARGAPFRNQARGPDRRERTPKRRAVGPAAPAPCSPSASPGRRPSRVPHCRPGHGSPRRHRLPAPSLRRILPSCWEGRGSRRGHLTRRGRWVRGHGGRRRDLGHRGGCRDHGHCGRFRDRGRRLDRGRRGGRRYCDDRRGRDDPRDLFRRQRQRRPWRRCDRKRSAPRPLAGTRRPRPSSPGPGAPRSAARAGRSVTTSSTTRTARKQRVADGQPSRPAGRPAIDRPIAAV